MKISTISLSAFITIFFIVASLFINNKEKSYAHIVTPSTTEYILVRGEQIEGSFIFENESSEKIQFTTKVYSYDAKEKAIIAENPFITLTEEKRVLGPSEKSEIRYKIDIPDNAEGKTYFNIISNEEIDPQLPDKAVGAKGGIGVLIVMHIVDSKDGNPLQDQFLNSSAVEIQVIQKGFPLLRPTIIEAQYQNQSKYVLHPTGEIRIVELYPARIISSLRFNEEADSVYPGEIISEQYEIETWTVGNSLKSMSSIARIQLVKGDSAIEDRVDFSVKNEFFLLILLITVAICLFAIFIANRRNSLKQAGR